jgi:ABC-type sugar transport system ATPase subunit
MDDVILEMRHIDKRFPGVQALTGVDFELRHGEVHALVGQNGAGKSTLIKILSGAYQPDGGEIILDGEKVSFSGPTDSQAAGIRTVYQETSLSPYLTVAENLLLGHEPMRPGTPFIDHATLHREASELLDQLGIDVPANTVLNRLPLAVQMMIEIGKALFADAKIIVVDEPSAAMTLHELHMLFEWIREQRSRGVAFIYISHRLGELFDIADRVTVLRDGELVDTFPIQQATTKMIATMMVGRDLDTEQDIFVREKSDIGHELLQAQGLGDGQLLKDVSFELRAGEIVGFAGLVGAGKTELAKCIFAARPYTEGELLLRGKPVRWSAPREAIEEGLALVAEDRRQEGLITILSVRDNVCLSSLRDLLTLGLLVDWRAVGSLVSSYITQLKIVTPSPAQLVMNLSGGNQQKVVLAKWLATKASVFIFDEPTRGIDVGAKQEVYSLMNELTANGAGILLMSSELPEVLGMADRVLVMREGRIVGEFEHRSVTEAELMACASGGEDSHE